MVDFRTPSRGNVVPFGAYAGSSKRCVLPLGPALGSTIERLQEIAAISGDHMVTEGPVHPDHRLLDLCAEALHLLMQVNPSPTSMYGPRADRPWTHAERFAFDGEQARNGALNRAAATYIKRAGVLPATTAAGVYAKALLVAGSATGAQGLARSLAADLIACHGLRQSLTWPDGQGEARP